MHSFGYRANALLTFAVMVLAFMCAMASLSDNLNSPSPSAHLQVSLSLSNFILSSRSDHFLFFVFDGIVVGVVICDFRS